MSTGCLFCWSSHSSHGGNFIRVFYFGVKVCFVQCFTFFSYASRKNVRSPFVIVPIEFIPPMSFMVCFSTGCISVWEAVPLDTVLERPCTFAQASCGSGG